MSNTNPRTLPPYLEDYLRRSSPGGHEVIRKAMVARNTPKKK